MSGTYVIETTYGIKYTNNKPVPIPSIIESLQSLERLIKHTPAFLEKHYEHIKITNMEVYVTSIESGSLTEEFLIRYIFKTDEKYGKAKELVKEIMDDSAAIKTIVAMGMGGIITYGIMSSLPSNTPTTKIDAHHNNIINIGASVDFSAKDLTAILEALPHQKKIAKDAVNVIKPAKADPKASIEIKGVSALNINKEAIAEAPDEYTPLMPAEKSEKHEKIKITISASDKDKYSTGWAGTVPHLIEKRTKFFLHDAVDPTKVHGKTTVTADIQVNKRFVKSKNEYNVHDVEILFVH